MQLLSNLRNIISDLINNTNLSTLYKSVLKSIGNAGIPLLIILPFIALYIFKGGLIFPLSTLGNEFPNIVVTLSFFVGNDDWLKDRRWVLVNRVSTPGQSDGPSLDEQNNRNRKAMDHFNGKLVEIIEMEESATTLDKEKFNRILKLAENDEFDVLAISQLDRLTRADPWEAMDFMRTLYQNNVTLCTVDDGPYDWEDVDDFDDITSEIVLARKHVLQIKKGQNRAYQSKLKEKKWVLGQTPPPLLYIDQDQRMHLLEGAEEVANEIYEKYLETGNMKETHRHIQEILPIGDIQSLSYGQILSIIGDRQLLGQFPSNGKILAEHEEFKVIGEDQMEKARDIRDSDSEKEDEKEPSEALETLSAFAERFGASHMLVDILTKFEPICECGEPLKWDGERTGKSLGIVVPEFECKSCGNTEKIPSREEMKSMHDVLPLRCPFCIGVENFTVDKINTAGRHFEYEYRCEVCGHHFGSDKSPNAIRRMLDHPELKFSIDDDSLSPDEESSNDQRLDNFR